MALAPINHKKICDSFGELIGKTMYQDRKMTCGKCGTPFVFTGEAQKHVFEKRSVPVSKAHIAAYCEACHTAKGIRNRTKKNVEVTKKKQKPTTLLFAFRQNGDVSILYAYILSQLRVLGVDSNNYLGKEKLLKELQKVQKRSPFLAEALYWEGRIYQAMRRPGTARARYRVFLKQKNRPKPLRPLWKDAEKRLARMASS